MLSNHEKELQEKGSIVTTVAGNSMLPFIRSEIDVVHIKKKENRIKIGDVVLYKRRNGEQVLHRIMYNNKNSYILCGDHELYLEKGIQEEQIIGVMSGYFKHEKYMDANTFLYKMLSIFWVVGFPIRKILAYLVNTFFGKEMKSSFVWLQTTLSSIKKLLMTVILLSLIQGVMFPAIALLIQKIIDYALNEKMSQVLIVSYAMLFLVLIQAMVHGAINKLSDLGVARIKKKLRTLTFKEILSSEYLQLSEHHSGEIVNRMIWDINNIAQNVLIALPNTILRLTQLCMLFIFLMLININLALLGIVYGVITSMIILLARKKTQKLYEAVRKEEEKLFSMYQETIANVLLVKSRNINDFMIKKTNIHEERLYERNMEQMTFSVKMYFLMEVFLRLGFVLFIIWGAYAVTHGRMSAGTLTAFALMSIQVQSQFLSISQSLHSFAAMNGAIKRIRELLNIEKEAFGIEEINEEGIAALYESANELKLESISYRYHQEWVFENADLIIEKNKFVAITGMSGIGKSTFLKLLIGVIKPSIGKVQFGDVDVGYATRKLFVYVPQNSSLLSGTIRENILLFSQTATQEEILEALQVSCAMEFVEGLRNGLETELGESGIGLSAGQIQRLAIARALLSKAPILLLDESTSALDIKTEEQVLFNLKNISNRTIIAITHRVTTLELFDAHYRIINKEFHVTV